MTATRRPPNSAQPSRCSRGTPAHRRATSDSRSAGEDGGGERGARPPPRRRRSRRRAAGPTQRPGRVRQWTRPGRSSAGAADPASAGRGRPRRWRARSSGRSSSGATGWARCRRRRWCTASRAHAEPGRPEVADQRGQPEQRLADQQLGDAGGLGGDVQVEVGGVVVGDPRRDRVPLHQLVEAVDHAAGVADVGRLEDRAQLALELAQHGGVAVGALVVQPRPARRGAGPGRRGRRARR